MRSILTLMLGALLVTSAHAQIPTTTGRTLRPPIQINGNADFNEDNGVVGGNGTASNPWVIADWEIDMDLWTLGQAIAGPWNAILIENTTDYVLIRNNKLVGARHNDPRFHGAIRLFNAPNVRIERNDLTRNNMSVNVTQTRAVVGDPGSFVVRVSQQNTMNGAFHIESVTGDILIEGNVINGFPRIFSAVSDIVMRGNVLNGGSRDSNTWIANGFGTLEFSRNVLTGSGAGTIQRRDPWAGLLVQGVAGPVQIHDNDFRNTRSGLMLEVVDADVQGNCFRGNLVGIFLEDGVAGTTIHGNDFGFPEGAYSANVMMAILNDDDTTTVDANDNYFHMGVSVIGGGTERVYGNVDVTSIESSRVAAGCGV